MGFLWLNNHLEITTRKIFKGENWDDVDSEDAYNAAMDPKSRDYRKEKGGKKKRKDGERQGEALVAEDLSSGKILETVNQTVEPTHLGNGEHVAAALKKSLEFHEDNNENKEGAWYPEMLDDLRLVTYFDDQLTKEKSSSREDSKKRLKEKGILLPELSFDKKDKVAYRARQLLRSACEFLWNDKLDKFQFPNESWSWSRENALKYLKDFGIKGHEGVPAISETKVKDSREEIKDNKEEANKIENENPEKLVWYEGIVQDLRDATNLKSSEEVWQKAVDNLNKHKVKLNISTTPKTRENWDRWRIETATDFLEGKENNNWTSKEAALYFLAKELGVGRGESKVDFDPNTIGNERTIPPEEENIIIPESKEKAVNSYVLEIYKRAILNEDFRKTNSFLVIKNKLEAAGVNIVGILGNKN